MTNHRIEALSQETLGSFLAYCRKHRNEVDDSFLYEEDLRDFAIHEDNPTYIALDSAEEVVGAVSLIKDAYHRKGRRGRFRIFHAEVSDLTLHGRLLKSIIQHGKGLDHLFVFVPTVHHEFMETLKKLDFKLERYAFILVHHQLEKPAFEVPDGYRLEAFRTGLDEEAWAEIRNAGFAKLKGNETPVTPDMVTKMVAEEDYLEGGMLMLYHGDRPVGIVRGSDDEFQGASIMNIGPVALVPEYQGKGLGRILLRAAMAFAVEQGYSQAILCVNAENERAKNLYLQEGFQQVEAAANFRYDLAK
ncbi:Mycothiol acetyltransferase [Paenibacillus sp. JJ-223]|nr:Mycothiol acetyltransferase [Paenibacillus sp. JJ-223]